MGGSLTPGIAGVSLLLNNCTIGKHIGMNKSDIIESIVYAGIPSGTTLVEHSNPTLGLTVAKITPANAGGLKILAARIFADYLKDDTADLPEVPDANLLRHLHNAVLTYHQIQVDNCMFEEVQASLVTEHRDMTARIHQIANELEITYKAPKASLLIA